MSEPRKVCCLLITRGDMDGSFVDRLPNDGYKIHGDDTPYEELSQFLEEPEVGMEITFRVVEYTEEELEAMPEFEGW